MKVTLYKFHKAYFGEFEKGSIHYARAIIDSEERIYQAFGLIKDDPITKYHEEPYSRQLAVGFLNNFWKMSNQYMDKPLTNLEYIRNKFVIPKTLLTNRKRLDVTCNYCYDSQEKRIIFLEYGDLAVVNKWLPIFKAFENTVFPTSPFPKIEQVLCWDLSKGSTYEPDYSNLHHIPQEKLITTAIEILKRS